METNRIINKDKIDNQALKEKIEQFKPRKFLTFFDRENFWLTPYSPEIFPSIMFVNDSHESMFLSNCNCGYIGHGPRNTQEVLMMLGMPEDQAERLIYNNTIQFSFTNSGEINYTSLETFSPFETRANEVKRGQVFLDHVKMHVVNNPRRLYFFESQLENLQTMESFIRVLRLSQPYKVGYHIKNYPNELIDSYMPDSVFRSKMDLSDKSRIHYIGEKFEIVLFEDAEDAVAIINMIHRCLTGQPLWNMEVTQNLIWYQVPERDVLWTTKLKRVVANLLHIRYKVDIKGMEVY